MVNFSHFEVHQNYPIRKLNSWRVGGAADFIAHLWQESIDLPIYFLGLGSNILIPDDVLPGIVIRTRFLKSYEIFDNDQVYAQCGLACAKLAKVSDDHGLISGSFFAGIPGTVGGALFMNAGAFGSETWRHVEKVKWLHTNGQIQSYDKSHFDISYRHTASKFDGWFLGAVFQFQRTREGTKTIKELLALRNQSQPIGTYNCGSVFKNPPGDFAARLIESCGLKGLQLGSAKISTTHANFIENIDGECRSNEILDLMALIQSRVLDLHGILLEPEVRILGFDHERK